MEFVDKSWRKYEHQGFCQSQDVYSDMEFYTISIKLFFFLAQYWGTLKPVKPKKSMSQNHDSFLSRFKLFTE